MYLLYTPSKFLACLRLTRITDSCQERWKYRVLPKRSQPLVLLALAFHFSLLKKQNNITLYLLMSWTFPFNSSTCSLSWWISACTFSTDSPSILDAALRILRSMFLSSSFRLPTAKLNRISLQSLMCFLKSFLLTCNV